jgi:hypothetical protein
MTALVRLVPLTALLCTASPHLPDDVGFDDHRVDFHSGAKRAHWA